MNGKRINRMLLISPPAYTYKENRDINPLPPMGLGYLASVAESMGIRVRILDCLVHGWEHEEEVDDLLIRVGVSYSRIREEIARFNPDLVGINCQFSRQHRIYHDILSVVKNLDSNIVTVTGGAHVTVCMDDMLSDSNCDFAIAGEAEDSFKELIRSINTGSDISHIDGLGWKKENRIIKNKKREFIADLDTLRFPAYHLMDLEKYFGLESSHGLRHKKRFVPIITSRGCPAKCTFCTAKRVWGRKFRARSVENVIDEIKYLKITYDIQEIMFEDDNLTANPKRAKNLFRRMAEEKFGIIWDTPNGVGVWSMDEEMLDLMKASGCIKVNFPVESGSQRVLSEVIKKPIKLDKVEKLIRHCQSIHLDYGMFLVLGMPGETIADMWESIKFAAKTKVFNPHLSIATPYPGSELFEICTREDYFSRPFSFDDLFIRSFMVESPEWKKEDIRKLLKKAKLYLVMKKIVNNPAHVIALMKIYMADPKRIVSYVRNLLN